MEPLGASGRAFGLEVCEAQPLSAVVLGAENVTAWRPCVKLVVGKETESNDVVVERADARSEKSDEGHCLHSGGGSGVGTGHAVALICVLQGHVEGLRVECLACSEDTARLTPRGTSSTFETCLTPLLQYALLWLSKEPSGPGYIIVWQREQVCASRA